MTTTPFRGAPLTDREVMLEKEIARLRLENAEIRRFYERPDHSLVQNFTRWWLGLDEYELVNLREALRAVAHIVHNPDGASSPLDVLNSGDWVMQILNRLETVAPLLLPNCPADQYRDSACAGPQ